MGLRAEYDLGLELHEIISNHFWRHWPDAPEGGYPTLQEWCFNTLGYRERKVRYQAKNSIDLKAIEIGEDTLVRALRIGWYRLAEILRAAKDEITLIEWLNWVETTKPTLDDFRAAIKCAVAGKSVQEAQATRADKAPSESTEPEGDESDTTEGSGSSTTTEAPARRYKWPLVFEDQESQKTFVKALNTIKRRLGDMGNGKAAALMATSYLGSLPREDEGGAPVELEYLLTSIEQTYGVKLQVVEEVEDRSAASVAQEF
jgi:hypothetical protein